MVTTADQRRWELERASAVLLERERNLRHLAQSTRCNNRAGAELELIRVREELQTTYARMRTECPDGFAGPRRHL